MRTHHRVASVLAIAVLAIALPASAQVSPGMTEHVSLPDGRQQPADVGRQGGGVRLGSGPGFAEVQIASLTTTTSCELDDPCIHREAVGAILGAGLEIVHTRHFGLPLRTQFVIDRHDVVPLLHIGLGFYL